jgi:hypothetical protein
VGNVQEGWSQFLDRCDLCLFCLISIWPFPGLFFIPGSYIDCACLC